MKDPGYVEVFNRIAPVYDRKFGKDCARAHALALEAAQIRGLSPALVLDVGCGTGQLLQDARTRWPLATLFGVDPAAGMVAEARRKLPGTTISMAQVEELPFGNATVDLVLSTTSFGHWTDQAAGLREIHRILRPGGEAIIVEHAPPGVFMRVLLLMMNRLPHLRPTPEVESLVEVAGLRLVQQAMEQGGFVIIDAVRPAADEVGDVPGPPIRDRRNGEGSISRDSTGATRQKTA